MVDDIVAVSAVVITALLVYLLATAVWRQRLEQFRKSSAQTQRSTLRGQVAERMASLFPQFIWNPSDAHFLGQPIDYIIFHGLTENRDGTSSKPVEIVFVEAKSGNQTLTPAERLVRDAVERKRVRYELMPLKVEKNRE